MAINYSNYSPFSRCKIRKRRLIFKTIIYCAALYLFINSIRHLTRNYFLYYYGDRGGVVDLSSNYFQSEEKLLKIKSLVNYQKCQIPRLDIWSDDVKKQQFDESLQYYCNGKQPHVTYVEGMNVIINNTALTVHGYSIKTVKCCYRTIERVEQNITNYDENADRGFKYSSECKKMDKVTRPTSAFIKVICHSYLFRLEPFSYVSFHALPLLDTEKDLKNQKSTSKQKQVFKSKMKFWKDCKESRENMLRNAASYDTLCRSLFKQMVYKTFPNVVIIGIDSTSRMNFRRFLKKSVMRLREIGAVEMKGYTKVGHNTLPNFLPLTTSYSLDEIEKTCYVNSSDPFDPCPFVWKEFSNQKYITAHLEDSPRLGIFNFLKTGFVEQPTDFYIRPLMLAMYKYDVSPEYTLTCVGHQRPEEIVLNFALELLKTANERNTPAFITTWLTDLTHEHMNSVEVMDDLLTNIIDKLVQYQLLQNTVVIVLSDHGYRFLPIRRTLSGWYEQSLPAFWIHIPESIQKILPNSGESLRENSRLLTTPYDIHATLKHILLLNSEGYNSSPDDVFRVRNGVSLFSTIPARSCEEAGVPQEYCVCKMPVRYDSNETLIQNAAYAALNEINSVLAIAIKCIPLRLSYVYLSGVLREETNNNQTFIWKGSTSNDLKRDDSLIIGFVTTPGNFMFDSLVKYDSLNDSFTKVVSVKRTDKIQIFPKCLEKATPILQEICFCS